jgi:type I restriction enzyme M protein
MAKEISRKKSDGGGLNFEAQFWAAADKIRGHRDASEYCFRADLHRDLKVDLMPVWKDLANPPFNMSDRAGENLRQDVRFSSLSASIGERAGVRCRIHSSPVNNANDVWIQHFIHHLSPVGVAGFVMANSVFAVRSAGQELRRQFAP